MPSWATVGCRLGSRTIATLETPIRCEHDHIGRAAAEATVDQRGLVERAREGDPAAFTVLVDLAIARLDAAARLAVFSPDDATRPATIYPLAGPYVTGPSARNAPPWIAGSWQRNAVETSEETTPAPGGP
jgi:hypothetical protein